MHVETSYLESAIKRFTEYKALGDKTFLQLDEAQMNWQPNESSNSIAILKSRCTRSHETPLFLLRDRLFPCPQTSRSAAGQPVEDELAAARRLPCRIMRFCSYLSFQQTQTYCL